MRLITNKNRVNSHDTIREVYAIKDLLLSQMDYILEILKDTNAIGLKPRTVVHRGLSEDL